MTTAFLGSDTSTCEIRFASSGFLRTSCSSRDARLARRRLTSAAASPAPAVRPSRIGRSNSAYLGPYSSITSPCSSIRNSSPPTREMASGRRSTIRTSTDRGSARRIVTSATHGLASTF